MAIAEHEPDKLYSRNKGMLSMSHEQLHDFAATKNAGKDDGDGDEAKPKKKTLHEHMGIKEGAKIPREMLIRAAQHHKNPEARKMAKAMLDKRGDMSGMKE